MALKLGPVRSAKWESIQLTEIETSETGLALPEQLRAVESAQYRMVPGVSGKRQRTTLSPLHVRKIIMHPGLYATRMPWVLGQWSSSAQGEIGDGRDEDSINIEDEEDVASIAPPLQKQAVQQFLLRGEWLIGWGWLYVFWMRHRSQRRRRLRANGTQKGRFL